MMFIVAIIFLIFGLIMFIWPLIASSIRGRLLDSEYIMSAFGVVMLILSAICFFIDVVSY